MEIVLLSVLFILAVLVYLKTSKGRPKNFPPGPTPWPFIGNVLTFGKKQPHMEFHRLAKVHGSVTGLQLSDKLAVVLNDWHAVNEALVKQGSIFAGRTQPKINFEFFHDEKGIIAADGEVWKEQRRFFLSNMRDFGFGKTSMEDTIMDGVNKVIQKIDKTSGKNINTETLFNFPVINILWRIFAGDDVNKKFDEEQSDKLVQLIAKEFKAFKKAFIVVSLPWLNTVGLAKYILKDIVAVRKPMDLMFQNIIDDHSATFNEDNIRDYMDLYIKEMRKVKQQQKMDSSMDNENLLTQMLDVFHAGIDTVSRTLSWSMAFMAKYPHVQSKLQQEIDSVIGTRTVSSEDKPKLVYTEATILECHRMASIVPLSLFHRCTEDTILLGYTIPKDTIVIPSIYGVHYDKTLWEEPTEFRPERFIDNGKVNKPEYLIPFSIGKRVCPGENLAKLELFMFFVTLMQNFTVEFSKGRPHPDLSDTTFGTVLFAPAHTVTFTRRH